MYEYEKESYGGTAYEVVEYRPRRKSKRGKGLAKLASVCLVAVCLGGSFGFGLGMSGLAAPKRGDEADAAASEAALAADSGGESNVRFVNSVITATNGVADVVKKSANSVVSISVSGMTRTIFRQLMPTEEAGSGIIIGEEGDRLYIATNNHVISNAVEATVSVDDSKQVAASYVGSDPDRDLAVISVLKSDMDEAGVPYSIAKTGSSDLLEVGEIVVAIGNALGEGKTATMGIVSAKNKELNIDGRTITTLQTDAAINPGNSGGALINLSGEVIGINTAKLQDVGVEGMGYSIPIKEALITIERLITDGSAVQAQPYLGIEGIGIDEEFRDAYGLPSVGVYVRSVIVGSGAAAAGIKPGDLIASFAGKKLDSMEDLQAALDASAVGDTVELVVYREGVPTTVNVKLQDANQRF